MNTKLSSLTNLQICHFSILLATNKQPAIIASFLPRWYFFPACCSFQDALEYNNNNKAQKHHNNKPSDKNLGTSSASAPVPLITLLPSFLPHRTTGLAHPSRCVLCANPHNVTPQHCYLKTAKAEKTLGLNGNGNILWTALNQDCLWQ